MNIGLITWGATENLIVAPILILAIFFLFYRFRRSKRAAKLLAASSLAAKMLRNFSSAKLLSKMVLMTLGMLFLFLALLRPQWNRREETVMQEGRDLFIALDVSRSMLARDYEPDRLNFAKKKIKRLLHTLDCERVGLLLFSGTAFVQCPLTSDHAAFTMFLDSVDVETISSGTTALDLAIKKVLEAFGQNPDRKNKLLVLYTDGEDFSSNLAGVKRQAHQEGLHIFTMGVGTPEGAPIPLLDEKGKPKGHQLDQKGAVVISRLNEGILHTLAADSGGAYIRLTQDDTDIKALMRQVQQFEKEQLEDKKFATLEEQYPYFLLISLISFALEWLL